VQDPGPASCVGLGVVVVDDNDDSRDLLGQALTDAGATVRLASSAREALSMLHDVDVVVTDYAMPGDTGLWLLGQVRGRPKPVPVIVLTGYADLYLAELAAAPFARVLRKPIDPWALCREVRDVVRRAQEAGG
jgi:CheY-like chemotaxis protein